MEKLLTFNKPKIDVQIGNNCYLSGRTYSEINFEYCEYELPKKMSNLFVEINNKISKVLNSSKENKEIILKNLYLKKEKYLSLPQELIKKKKKYDDDLCYYVLILDHIEYDFGHYNNHIPNKQDKKQLINVAVDCQKSCKEILIDFFEYYYKVKQLYNF